MESVGPSVKKLVWLHLAAALFMTMEAIALGSIKLDTVIVQTVGFPVRSNGPQAAGQSFITPAVKSVYDLKVKSLIVAFVALAAADHWICFLIGKFKLAVFDRWVTDYQANPLRWIEYSVSASLMSVLLAGLCGISDIHLLVVIGVLTGICNLTGLVVEFMPKLVDGRRNNAAFGVYLIGWLALVVSWLPGICYFAQADVAGNVPGFVYAAYILTAVCYACFGLNFHLHWFTGKYGFARSEQIYIILSFTAKSFLAWDVFFGYRAQNN
jgi:hypothetical protein